MPEHMKMVINMERRKMSTKGKRHDHCSTLRGTQLPCLRYTRTKILNLTNSPTHGSLANVIVQSQLKVLYIYEKLGHHFIQLLHSIISQQEMSPYLFDIICYNPYICFAFHNTLVHCKIIGEVLHNNTFNNTSHLRYVQ